MTFAKRGLLHPKKANRPILGGPSTELFGPHHYYLDLLQVQFWPYTKFGLVGSNGVAVIKERTNKQTTDIHNSHVILQTCWKFKRMSGIHFLGKNIVSILHEMFSFIAKSTRMSWKSMQTYISTMVFLSPSSSSPNPRMPFKKLPKAFVALK